MNGVHDMGGITGFGPLQIECGEPVFHADWEARTFAMLLAIGAWRRWSIDESRHQRELIPAAEYLRMSYYERWYAGLVALAVKHGLVSPEEVEAGVPNAAAVKAEPPLTAAMVESFTRRARSRPPASASRAFAVGDRVRARNLNPTGHTRLPRYVRGKPGVIAALRGDHSFPDDNADGLGPNPQPLYSVRFQARELWGETANARDTVHLDLWEAYLESVTLP